jgi:hypothetical protein
MKAKHVGYLGVIVPDVDFWQGYFINTAFAEAARDALAKIRNDATLRRGSVVLEELGIAAADQPVVGSLCATIVEAALDRVEHPQAVIGTCSYALRKIVGQDYFWIEGKVNDKGVRTSIGLISVASISAARGVIDALPAVRQIKTRLLNSVMNRMRK